MHIPHHNLKAVYKALEIIKNEKPDAIVLAGDILDFPALSKYDQVPGFERISISEQLEICYKFLEKIRKDNLKAEIYYIEGNHDFRFRSYPMKRAPELYDYMDLEVDLDLKGLKIKWVGTRPGAARWTDTYVDIEGIKIGHFDRVATGSGNTARNIMRDKGNVSVVQGHVHRAGIIYFTDINGNQTFGVENPCLCADPTYASMTNWQRGLTIIDKIDGKWRPRVIVF